MAQRPARLAPRRRSPRLAQPLPAAVKPPQPKRTRCVRPGLRPGRGQRRPRLPRLEGGLARCGWIPVRGTGMWVNRCMRTCALPGAPPGYGQIGACGHAPCRLCAGHVCEAARLCVLRGAALGLGSNGRRLPCHLSRAWRAPRRTNRSFLPLTAFSCSGPGAGIFRLTGGQNCIKVLIHS